LILMLKLSQYEFIDYVVNLILTVTTSQLN